MYKSNNIILIGFKGANKTKTARRLAEMLGFTFLDLDTHIENLYFRDTQRKLKYRQIAAQHGDAYFKQIERKALESIKSMDHMVLGTAGNTPFDPVARRILRRMGQIIFMRAGPEQIYARMTQDGIPHFLSAEDPKGSFDRYYRLGVDHFQNTADLIIWVKDLSTEQMAAKIREELKDLIY